MPTLTHKKHIFRCHSIKSKLEAKCLSFKRRYQCELKRRLNLENLLLESHVAKYNASTRKKMILETETYLKSLRTEASFDRTDSM